MTNTCDDMLCKLGDCVADVFEQMLKGKWRDEYGHDVYLNDQMWRLKECLKEAVAFRALPATPDVGRARLADCTCAFGEWADFDHPPEYRTDENCPLHGRASDSSIGMRERDIT